jgi:hypothetical protein
VAGAGGDVTLRPMSLRRHLPVLVAVATLVLLAGDVFA